MSASRPDRNSTHLLLGTDTGKGIYRATWDPKTGSLGPIELHVACDRPVYFAHHPTEPVLYVNNELSGGKAGLSSFRVKGAELTEMQHLPCDDGPCYVSCTSSHVYSANYSAGSFEAWELGRGGEILPASRTIRAAKFNHPGPVPDRQDNPHFHCAVIAPGQGWVLVCDLGGDCIRVVKKDLTYTVVPTRPGSGPRHVAFHPNGRWVYCIYELDCTIDRFDWHDGELTPSHGPVTQVLQPGTPLKGNTACELLFSPSGDFAYATVRGTDELLVYAVEAKTGALTEQQRMPIGGKTPRLIAFDPTFRWLVSCNQGAPGNVTVFAHDVRTGRIDPQPQVFAGPTPMCVAWL